MSPLPLGPLRQDMSLEFVGGPFDGDTWLLFAGRTTYTVRTKWDPRILSGIYRLAASPVDGRPMLAWMPAA